MATNGITVANSSAALATEVLVEQIGIELAQKVNTPEIVWVKTLDGTSSATAHYRWENALSVSTLSTAVEGNATGLPAGSWSLSSQTITTALEGMSIPVGVQILSLAPEVMASVSRQVSTVLERAIDSSVCTLFPSLTTTSVGTSGAALTVANILTANSRLDALHADNIGGYMGRLSAYQFNNLYQDILSKNCGIAKLSIDAMGKDVIDIGGTIIKKNSFTPTINSGANYCGAILVNQAIGLVVGLAPQVQIAYVGGTGQYFVDGFLSIGAGVLRSTLGVPVISGVSA